MQPEGQTLKSPLDSSRHLASDCSQMAGFLLLAALTPIILYVIWPILVYFVFRILLCRSGDLLKAGEWTVITGATDGIGKAFAELLAKKGLNIFLISRNKDKLQAVASEIEMKYKVKTKIFAADFGEVCPGFFCRTYLVCFFS